MLVNFYRFFTLVNEQKRQKENDARVSKILMHEEGAHANRRL